MGYDFTRGSIGRTVSDFPIAFCMGRTHTAVERYNAQPVILRSVAGVSDHGGRVCSTSGVVLLAFHHSVGHLCSGLLEYHLNAPTPCQGRRQSAAAAHRRRSINIDRCLRLDQSLKASEQDTEERCQDDDHHHYLLRCLLAACPVHDRRPDVRPAFIEFSHLVLRFRGDRFPQLMCPSVHLRYGCVPVSERQVRCRAASTGA